MTGVDALRLAALFAVGFLSGLIWQAILGNTFLAGVAAVATVYGVITFSRSHSDPNREDHR